MKLPKYKITKEIIKKIDCRHNTHYIFTPWKNRAYYNYLLRKSKLKIFSSVDYIYVKGYIKGKLSK